MSKVLGSCAFQTYRGLGVAVDALQAAVARRPAANEIFALQRLRGMPRDVEMPTVCQLTETEENRTLAPWRIRTPIVSSYTVTQGKRCQSLTNRHICFESIRATRPTLRLRTPERLWILQRLDNSEHFPAFPGCVPSKARANALSSHKYVGHPRICWDCG